MTTDNEKRLAALLHEERIGCTPSRGSDYDLRCHNDAAARLTARGVTVGLDVEAAHVVEQQGLALGRLRAAAQAYLDAEEALDTWDVAHHFVINSERDRLDGMKAEAREAMRAALEEADRG